MKKIVIVLILFVSCKAKEKSIYIEKDLTVKNIILESKNTLEVSTLCDSIGNAKEFVQTINNKNATTKVSIKDNILKIETKSDSIVYVDKEILKYSQTVKYKTHHYIYILIFVQFLIILILLKIWRYF